MANRVFEVFSKWTPKDNFCHIYESYEPIYLIFCSKYRNTIFYLVTNFEKNRSINATMRVLDFKNAKKFKMAAMTSSFLKLKKQTKKKRANFF